MISAKTLSLVGIALLPFLALVAQGDGPSFAPDDAVRFEIIEGIAPEKGNAPWTALDSGRSTASFLEPAFALAALPRKYERGSLGMPRGPDVESGGSQLFVTHRPTPHLDGRYTIFGELVAGGEVLDAIDVGDRILEVRVR